MVLLPALVAVPLARAIEVGDGGATPSPAPSAPASDGYGHGSGDGGSGLSPSAPASPTSDDGPHGPAPDQFAKKNDVAVADAPLATGGASSGELYGPSSGDGGPKPLATAASPPPTAREAGDAGSEPSAAGPAGNGIPLLVRSDMNETAREIKRWNRYGSWSHFNVLVPTADHALDLFGRLLDGPFKKYPEVPTVRNGTRKPGTHHWDIEKDPSGALIGHSKHSPEAEHLQIDTYHRASVRIFWERDRFSLLDPEPAAPLVQPAGLPEVAKGPVVLTSPGVPGPGVQDQRLVSGGEVQARELLRALNKHQEGFTLAEPSAGPTTPGVAAQPQVSPPLLAASPTVGASTHRLTPGATAPPTGPLTDYEVAVDTYLRPAVRALEPYVGRVVATIVVAGAVVVGVLAWRALTSCGGPCALRPTPI